MKMGIQRCGGEKRRNVEFCIMNFELKDKGMQSFGILFSNAPPPLDSQ